MALVATVTAGGAPRDENPREEKFEGTWRQTHAEFEGQASTESQKPYRNHWVITRDTITIYMEGGHRGAWSYQLDPDREAGGR